MVFNDRPASQVSQAGGVTFAGRPGPTINPHLHGIFLAAINHGREALTSDVIINSGADTVPATLNVRGVDRLSAEARVTVLHSPALADNNSLDEPTKVIPIESIIKTAGTTFQHEFPAYSLSILRLKTR